MKHTIGILIFLTITSGLFAANDTESLPKTKLSRYRVWKFDYKRDVIGIGKLPEDPVPQIKHYRFVLKDGVLLELQQYARGRKLMKTHKYTYNEEGLKTAVVTRNAKDKITQTGEIIYDVEGKRIKESYFTPERQLIIEYKYKYDPEGRIIEVAGSKPSGEFRKSTEITYDETGNITEIKYLKNDEVQRIENIKYGQRGREIARTVFNENNEVISSSMYRYDENGNRISVISEQTLLTEEELKLHEKQRKKGLHYLDGKWVTQVERDRILKDRRKKQAQAAAAGRAPFLNEPAGLPPLDGSTEIPRKGNSTAPPFPEPKNLPPLPPPKDSTPAM